MKRWQIAVVFMLVLAALPATYFAWTQRDMPHLGLHHDDELYWVSGWSLAQGQGFTIASLPWQPAQTKYPILYPALLAVIWKLAPNYPANLPWAMLLSWLAAMGYLVGSWFILRQFGLPPAARAAVCLLIGMSPMFVIVATSMMTELVCGALLLGALYLAERAYDEDRLGLALAAGMLAGLAYLTRSLALPLIVTTPLIYVVRRRAKLAGAFVVAMLPAVAGWQIFTSTHLQHRPGLLARYYTDYVTMQRTHLPLDIWPQAIWINADHLITSIGQSLTFVPQLGFFSIQALRFVGLVALIGAGRLCWKTKRWHLGLASAAMCTLLVLWHYPPNTRFVLPMIVLLVVGFCSEAAHFAQLVMTTYRRNKSGDRASAMVLGGVAACGLAYMVCLQVESQWNFLPRMYATQRAMREVRLRADQWVKANTPADATVWSYDDGLVFLEAGRRGATLPIIPDLIYRDTERELPRFLQAFPGFLDENGLRYVLFTNHDFHRDLQDDNRRKLIAGIKQSGHYQELVSTKEFAVYQRLP